MRGIDSCLVHDHGEDRTPLALYPLHPLARSIPGETDMRRSVLVCPNVAVAAYRLLDHLEGFALTGPTPSADYVLRGLPANVWRRYEDGTRALAYKSWRIYGPRFLSGHYADLHRVWHPDGSAKVPDVPSVKDLDVLTRWPRRLRRKA